MQKVRWGIIGVGDVTEKKSGPGFQQAERSKLVAVMRRSADKASDYAKRHGVATWYDNAQALIHDPNVNAVYIATPPDLHKDYTLQVAAAGKPVYVEKPMARTATECEAMNAACKEAGVPLFVAYYRRAMPRFKKVKALLDAGAIGEIRSVMVRLQHNDMMNNSNELPWRVQPEVSGGGYFVDMGSHTLDLLDWLFGPVTHVSGVAVNQAGHYPAEDLVAGTFGFATGVHGIGLWCFSAHESLDQVEIVGSKGSLRFSSFDESPLQLTVDEEKTMIEAPYPATVQAPLIQSVVDELTGRGQSPSTGESAFRTAKVIDTLLGNFRRSP